MIFVFDMDGTLVDSRQAVIEAYKMAGVRMPADAWGKTAEEWGVTPDQHALKSRLYPNALRQFGRPMPTLDFFRLVDGFIITGASLEAARAVSEFLSVDPTRIAGVSLTERDKMRLLEDWAENETVFYVDDNFAFGIKTVELEGVSFMHVTEHEGAYNLWQMRDGKPHVQRWTLSGWFDRPPVDEEV